jgi:hypothetical protein
MESAMSTKRPIDQFSFSAPVPAHLRPLGMTDLTFVQHILAEIAPEWSAELQGICADEATLILVPDGGDDDLGPSFMISRDAFGLRVDQVHWDTVTEIGLFTSLNDVLEAIRLSLAMCAGEPEVVSYTVH